MPAPQAYFDTSVLMKRYVEEAGSIDAAPLFRQFQVVSSTLAPVEMLSALLEESMQTLSSTIAETCNNRFLPRGPQHGFHAMCDAR